MTLVTAMWATWLKGIPSRAEYVVLLVAAFLDPVLRLSPESDITLFRVIFPLFLIVRLPALAALPAFRTAASIVGIAVTYMLLQLVILGHLRDFTVQSYGLLVVAAALFLYLTYAASRHHGVRFVLELLAVWYVGMVAASLMQIYLPFEFPNATYRAGVGRIYFGQENDASVAIAAFFPLLLLRIRPTWLAWLLVALGLFIIYENGTRMAILAIALLLAVMATSFVAGRIAERLKVPAWLILLAAGIGLFMLGFLLRDVPIQFPDHSASLVELVVTPLQEVLGGVVPSEYTSVNVRVTTVIAGLASLVQTLGFGVGPGASRFIVAQIFDTSQVTSMHSFPVQLVVELGWLLVAVTAFMLLRFRRQIDWNVFGGVMVFNVALVASVTSGTITNYFFLACLAAEFIVFRMPRESATVDLAGPRENHA